jgi:hypothetical protein
MELPATQFCEIEGRKRTQGEKQITFRSTALPTFQTEYIIIILNTSNQQVQNFVQNLSQNHNWLSKKKM